MSTKTKREPISEGLRRRVYEADRYTCVECKKKRPEVRLVVGHIKPVAKRGGDEFENLYTSCETCNSSRGAITLPRSTVERHRGIQREPVPRPSRKGFKVTKFPDGDLACVWVARQHVMKARPAGERRKALRDLIDEWAPDIRDAYTARNNRSPTDDVWENILYNRQDKGERRKERLNYMHLVPAARASLLNFLENGQSRPLTRAQISTPSLQLSLWGVK